MNTKIEIFIDGSCLKNPGPGGYGIIMRYKKYKKILSSGYYLTTNNRMELMSAIIALESLTTSSEVILSTDSQYVYQGITKWIENWKKYNWKNSSKKLIKNIDLWKRLDKLTQHHSICWNWIKGHSGLPENEYCDYLAKNIARFPILNDIGYILELQNIQK